MRSVWRGHAIRAAHSNAGTSILPQWTTTGTLRCIAGWWTRMTIADVKRRIAVSAMAFAMLCTPVAVQAQSRPAEQLGVSTGLPIPRYVSLKSGEVNMRRGPGREHQTDWTYHMAGLPLEVTGEFENWRKVRDWEGAEGWIFHTLLSGRRTAMVTPWEKQELTLLRRQPGADADVVARLEPGVVARVRSCDGSWCRISGQGFDGFAAQEGLWGVYPNETFR